MDFSLSQLRRDLTQRAIRSAIAATARVSIDHQRRTIRSLTRLLGETPMLRRRVRTNMLMALGDNVPPDAEILYFRRLGWFLASALAVFHHGTKASAVFDEIKFDQSIAVLDAAVAEGRGAVIISPHWCGHELVAAEVNRRHRMTLLVVWGSRGGNRAAAQAYLNGQGRRRLSERAQTGRGARYHP